MEEIIISFITINYNSAVFTTKLIASIMNYATLPYEIIVVDNDSKEDDLLQLQNYCKDMKFIKIIENHTNEGFAKGNMLGCTNAKGKYLLFINNDTLLFNDISKIMKNYMDTHPNTALVTGRIEDDKGKFSSSYKLFPSVTKELFGNTIARFFSKNNFPSNKIELTQPTKVEVVSGSCMFFRAKDFFEIGGFDTNFFLYCEEEDISKRVWDYGKEVVFLPDAKIFHASGGSTVKSFEIEREYYISYHYLIKKHFNSISYFILRFLLLYKLFRRSFKRKNGWKLFCCALKKCPQSFSLGNLYQRK